MKQLIGICCKSTFVALLVFAMSNAALAQFGYRPNHVIGGNTNTSGCGIGDGNAGWNNPCARFGSSTNIPQSNLYEAMKAQNVPSTIHVEDLTTDWHVIATDSPGYYGYRNSNLYYTHGDMFIFGDQKFLVAYHLLDSSDPDQRAAQQYFSAQVGKDDSKRIAPLLLKNSQLALTLFSLSQAHDFQEIEKFDPAKDIAAAPPKFLIDRRISQAQLKQIALGMFMYAEDYDEKLPPMVAARNAKHLMYLPSSKTTFVPTVQNLLQPYMHSTEIFLQPTTHRPYLPNYKMSRLPLSKIDDATQTFLFYEDAPDADGKRSVADGHVETMEENQFQWRRKAQGISESGYPSAAKPTQKAKATPKA
jgi:hypothetical protein